MPLPRYFNILDWYWIVAGSTTQVFSSARSAYVPTNDTQYAAWMAADASRGPGAAIDTENNLVDFLASSNVPVCVPSNYGLKSYSAYARYQQELLGITWTGKHVATDPVTRAALAMAVVPARTDNTYVLDWKFPDGTFMHLTAAQMLDMYNQVNTYVQGLYTIDKNVGAGVDGGTIKTKADVDAAY